jgi:GAF domain-containing protein
MQSNQAADDIAIARRQSELGKQSKQFAQQYALQGLQNDIAAQSQRNNLIQGRLDGVFGPVGNILRGLSE